MAKTKIDFPSSIIKTNRADSNFGQYRFPLDLGPNSIVLDFQKYSYQRTTQGVNPTGRTTTSIVLPLPEQIQDAYNIIVQEQQLGVIGAAIVDQFSGGGANTEKLKGLLDKAKEAGAQAGQGGNINSDNLMKSLSTSGQYAKFISRSFLDSLPVEGLSLATDIVTGSAINPHTTLNFDGVGLKKFEFNWTLAPRSQKESDELRNIINKIKGHILPKYSTLPGLTNSGNRAADQALLRYPDLALIRFNGLAQGHWFEFKPGMISNMSVNYSPQGNVLLEGGKPAVVHLSMSFTEAQIHTSGPYEDSASGSGLDIPQGIV